MTKIFIAGATGFLGSALARRLAEFEHEVYTIYRNGNRKDSKIFEVPFVCYENSSNSELSSRLGELGVEIIINCIGCTNVDYCEKNSKHAIYANIEIPKKLSAVANAIGSRLIHVSSDQVVGSDQPFASESVDCRPVNVYALTKLFGEFEVSKQCQRSLILRTNFFGTALGQEHTFCDWALRELKQGKPISGYTDVYFNPLFINNLIDAIIRLFDIEHRGILNLTASDRISKYQFLVLLAEYLNCDSSLVRQIEVREHYKTQRPKEMTLSNHLAESRYGICFSSIRNQIRDFKESSLNNT